MSWSHSTYPLLKIWKIIFNANEFVKKELKLAIQGSKEEEFWLWKVFREGYVEGNDESELRWYSFLKSLLLKVDDSTELTIDYLFDRDVRQLPYVRIVDSAESLNSNNVIGDSSINTIGHKSRSYSTTFNIMIGSDSSEKTMILTDYIHALLISIRYSLEHYFERYTLMTDSMTLEQNAIPTPQFVKLIKINCSYYKEIPLLSSESVGSNVVFNAPVLIEKN